MARTIGLLRRRSLRRLLAAALAPGVLPWIISCTADPELAVSAGSNDALLLTPLLMPSLPDIILEMTCIFGAAIVRGYSGFGFSLLSITALSLFLEPRAIIPSIFILEVAASAHLMLHAWRAVHWQSLRRLVVGCILGTPAGVYVLARVAPAPLTLALSAIVLVIATLLAHGFVFRAMPGRTATVTTGVASGLLNGSIGIGGPPVVMFFFGSPAGVATGRASMIAYFLFTDLLGLACQWHENLVNRDVLVRALWYAPALGAGVWLGNRAFAAVNPVRFRYWVLRLLMALAALTGAHALWDLHQSAPGIDAVSPESRGVVVRARGNEEALQARSDNNVDAATLGARQMFRPA